MGTSDRLLQQSWLIVCFLSQSPGTYNLKSVRFVCLDVDIGLTSGQRRLAAVKMLTSCRSLPMKCRLIMPLPRCRRRADVWPTSVCRCRDADGGPTISDITPFCTPICRHRAGVGPTSTCHCRDTDLIQMSFNVGPTSACLLGMRGQRSNFHKINNISNLHEYISNTI